MDSTVHVLGFSLRGVVINLSSVLSVESLLIAVLPVSSKYLSCCKLISKLEMIY